ncbi:chemotaxis protein CheA [Heliophilum fasciatum]|uniref:histidine kinase n=1 Tax=Heliophilum fasciatum TaxID=35700 RepID=A0A4V2SX66_9FIRM|nr:chemotaxis protein CheA [Heliophilum fasciatum]MCW2277780.1 two-component system chemotaxis sensor kinase CheA [Heliophilum fasciatum]TCP64726.1 two-component system chemotaxis sensor kinase CheA [Heliophilum fasciatum]
MDKERQYADMVVDQEILDQCMDVFYTEAKEQLQVITDGLLAIEAGDRGQERINEMLRIAHSLKGTSATLGMPVVAELIHRIEDILSPFRDEANRISGHDIDKIFAALDLVQSILFHGVVLDEAAVKRILGPRQAEKKAAESAPDGSAFDPLEARIEKLLYVKPVHPRASIEANEANAAQRAKPATEPEAPMTDVLLREPLGSGVHEILESKGTDLIRVEAARLDGMMNWVGELITAQARSRQIQQALQELYGRNGPGHELLEVVEHLRRISQQLQGELLKMRMVPIGMIFSRFSRTVRDIAKRSGKKIRWVVEGEKTEIDKSVADQLADPLLHILRNACSHGIESPEERMEAGKPTEGTVTMSARQKGNRIVIQVADDGRGIDVQKVLDQAQKMGWFHPDQQLTQTEIFSLIFLPGLSTAETVTDISGRGIGMDVVKQKINQLQGSITVRSQKGEGTTVTLQLPLTLSILRGLIVRVEEEHFVIPLDDIHESIQLRPSEITTFSTGEMFSWRGRILTLRRLQEVLDVPRSANKPPAKKRNVVLVHSAERYVGLEVDQLVGQQEIVVKPVQASWMKLDYFSGATVLGDGKVALIMNIAAVINPVGKTK